MITAVPSEHAKELLATLTPERRARMHPGDLEILERMAGKPAGARPTKLPKIFAPYANKTEFLYAQRLESLRLIGEISAWTYEPEPLIAAGGTRYTPDFLVDFPDGHSEYHETKGHLRSRDAVRMREARMASPYPIRVIKRVRGGRWETARTYEAGKA